jgi:hypothetical protein
MQAMPIRIFLVLFILALIYPSALLAATERRIALVIGNSAYSSGPLKNPVNDAAAMATQLQKFGFTVILKKNANLRGMEDALTEFGDRLKRGGVGLFFYAGHGLQVGGANYLVPIGARISREADIKYETLDAGKILDEMATANNGLNIVIFDACRDNPYSRSFRNASRGLAIVSNAPVGTFISYSTSPGNVASDGDGRNSPYTQALLWYMKEPGLTIEQVFKGARAKLGKDTGGKQIPWELSSLQGEFYFVPGSGRTATDITPPGKIVFDKTESAADPLDDETMKLEDEDRKLEKEKALLEKKKVLEDKRQKIEEEKATLEAKKTTTLAMSKRPTVSIAKEIKRDGRFIAYDDGTVLDTKTKLMWAARDNGSNINWANAKSYCENYRGGGYSDWRMPTPDELAGLYDASKTRQSECRGTFGGTWDIHLTELIHLTCLVPWTSEMRGSKVALFRFDTGDLYWTHSFSDRTPTNPRALPVRSGK